MYYIEKYKPFDKAGSYGIQEWIGNIAINEIRGSYNNVVGLPTSKLYQYLKGIN
jgi:septum formation protein